MYIYMDPSSLIYICLYIYICRPESGRQTDGEWRTNGVTYILVASADPLMAALRATD